MALSHEVTRRGLILAMKDGRLVARRVPDTRNRPQQLTDEHADFIRANRHALVCYAWVRAYLAASSGRPWASLFWTNIRTRVYDCFARGDEHELEQLVDAARSHHPRDDEQGWAH